MSSISLLSIFYFLLVAFAGKWSADKFSNPFLSYYDIQINFIYRHLVLFILLILIIAAYFLVRRKHKKHNFGEAFLHFIAKLFQLAIFYSFISFFVLIFLAALQLNFLSALTYTSPQTLGVETKTERIITKLKGVSVAPTIVMTDINNKKIAVSIAAKQQAGENSFYGSRIVSSIPSFLVIPPNASNNKVLLVGDTLVVKDISSPDFQKVSPVVSYLLVKDFFPGNNVKNYPVISMMEKEEYVKEREEDFSRKADTIEKLITSINNSISELTEEIDSTEKQMDDNKKDFEEKTIQKEKEYIRCVNAGYYKDGIYIKTNTKVYCQEKNKDLEDAVALIKKQGEDLSTLLEEDQRKMQEYEGYIKFYNAQKILTREESNYVSYEYGAFNPPGEIKIKYTNKNNSKALADFLETLVHEYLHYATYSESDKKLTSGFFNEGLTEYFARKIIKDNLKTDTNLGYPVNVKILTQMAKRISDGDFADIYFKGDQENLEKMIDRVYGKNFYKNNIITLETLQYLSEKEVILKYANQIMAKIGGEVLSEKDVMTSAGSFL